MKSFKIFMAKLVVWTWFHSNLFRYWSKVYQWVWERNKTMLLYGYRDITELVSYVGKLKWRADTWREVGDAVSSPEHVQWLAEHEPEKFIGDCDEFAVYQAAVVNRELDMWNPSFAEYKQAYLMSVAWYHTPNGRFGGHNVCLLQDRKGKYSYMDYGFPSQKVETLEEIAHLVMKRYAGQYEKIGWVVSEVPTLKKLDSSIW